MNYAIFEDLFSIPLRNGVSYPSSQRGSGYPMVNMGEAFRFDRIASQECERVPLKKSEVDRYILEGGDLLFVRQSLKFAGAGKCIYVEDGEEPRTWESHLIRVRLNQAISDSRYYFYYFRSPVGRLAIESIIEQVAAAGIRGSDLRRLQVPVPPVSVQAKIADVLSALDDKIQVNDRIARASFDLAETRHRQLCLRSDSSVALGEILELKYGKALPASYRIAGSVPVFGSSGIVGNHNEALADGPGIIVGRKGTVGAVHWAETDFFSIDTTFYVQLRRTDVPMEFAFFSLRGLGLETMNSDSAVPGLNRSNALALRIILPGDRDLQAFYKEVHPGFALRGALSAESPALAQLRDSLLPKLMSGEIRVRDAERLVEDAT
jgi:type I restriction enzyme, S subunit